MENNLPFAMGHGGCTRMLYGKCAVRTFKIFLIPFFLIFYAWQAQGQLCPVFVNEFHYDNSGADVNEFIEVAGDAGSSVSGWKIYMYSGDNGAFYSNFSLTGTFPNNCTVSGRALGTLVFDVAAITGFSFQNGAPDGFALVKPDNTVAEFLSYEGVFTATNGPANGLISMDIGTLEPSTALVGSSIQRTATNTWVFLDGSNTFNACNTSQYQGPTCSNCPNLSTAPPAVSIVNSSCQSGCTVSGGSIIAPGGTPCPTGSTLQYKENSGPWGTTLPIYAQTGPAQTIKTRCNCDDDNTINSPEATATTIPGSCVPPTCSISGPTTVCANSTGNVYVASAGMTAYNWGITGSGTVVGSSTGSSVTVTAGASGSYTLAVTITNAVGCTSICSQVVNIGDVQPPTITCPPNATVNANASCQGQVGSYTPVSLSDNCNANPTFSQSPASTTVLTGHNTVQMVTLTANDGNGNTSTCSLNVTLKDVTAPTITCPPNATVAANSTCQGTVGTRTAATINDNCNPSPTVTQSPAASTILTGHNTVQTVTLTANDGNGNTATCALTVTLIDVAPPTVTCPPNTTVSAGPGCTGILGTYSGSVIDNCSSGLSTSQSPAPGTSFTGSQIVTLSSTDIASNTGTCSFVVSVTDNVPPSITCPPNATVNANASCQGQIGSYSPTSLSDNCNANPSVTQSPASSTVLTGHNSVQTVTLTANDGNGNTASCTLTVTLKDVTPPSITCPPNATVAANGSCQGLVGTRTASSLSDNCNPSPTVVQSPSAGTTLTGHNTAQTVTLTANDGNGNTSTCTLTVTLKDVTPPTLTCQSNVTINANSNCQGTLGLYTLTAIDNCTASIGYGQSPSDGTILTGHNTVQTVTLSGTDEAGNPASCTLTVTLKDVTPPSITCPPNATVAANASCQGSVGTRTAATLSDNCNPSPTVTQSPSAATILTGHNATQTVTLSANDGNGNTSTCTMTVTLKDVTPPTLVCPPNATVTANSSCQGTLGSYVAQSITDNCSSGLTATQSPASGHVFTGTQVVILTASDGATNNGTCSFSVSVNDFVPPTITCPANTTVAANASCQGQIGSYSPASLSDNCAPNPTFTQSPASSTVLTGHNSTQTVTLTATDLNSNTSSCTFVVTLKDVTGPSITCPPNATVAANSNCQGMVGFYTIVSGSDNCQPVFTYSQSPLETTLLSGHNTVQTVTLTANDGNGNTSTCTLTVTLKDVTPPTITCQSNVTINANASCQGALGLYTLTGTDNCASSLGYTQSPALGTIITGHNTVQTVTLTANDGNGNASTCTLTVTLKDVTPPSITCPPNTTVAVNASCQGTLGNYTPTALSDNCAASITATQSPVSGTVLSGHNTAQTVTLTANDGNGNTSTCTLTVTLKDVTPPSITCPPNATVAANASCQGAIGSYTPTALSDNCSVGITATQSPASSMILSGHNATQTVTLTANDGNGNTSTCTLTVTLKDVTQPNITCPANTTVNVGASCTATLPTYAPSSMSDNCSVPTLAQSPAAGTVLSGHNTVQTVTLTATDGAVNSRTCTFTVTLKDVTAPSIVCKNATVNLNGNSVNITPAQVYQSGSDNCGVVNLQSVNPSSFTCANIGNNTVVLTANDGNGNSSTCSAVVTVRDITPPTAVCRTTIINADLNINGTVTVLPTAINNGSSDNCSFTMTVTPPTFGCANIGLNTVTLRVTDAGGNSATCTATVRVRDLIGPTARCKNPTIYLNNQGQATLTVADVNNGSTDACGISSMSLSQTQFTCAELAGSPWSVTLSMTDVNGNSSSCQAYVTVNDIIAPDAVCEDVEVHLGSNGRVIVYGANLAANSTDNCSVWSYSPIAKMYTAANLGTNNLTITVKDYKGNAATCVSVVTVLPYDGNNLIDNSGNGDQDVELTGSDAFNFAVYPNPTSGAVNVAMEIKQDETIFIRIFDLNGRMIYLQETEAFEGENVFRLRLDELNSGLYVIEVQAGGFKGAKRILIQE